MSDLTLTSGGSLKYSISGTDILITKLRLAVPNIVGMTKAQAQTAIVNAGFTIGTTTGTATNNVISQVPAAGTMTLSGNAINMTMATSSVSVPNLFGMTELAARSAITNAGLTVGTITGGTGTVQSQSPTQGTLVNAYSSVNFVKATVTQTVSVPDVVGMTQAAATTAIQNVGLTLGTVTGGTGLVQSQSPTAGTVVNVGTTVNIVKATVTTTVAVPNLVGMTQANATTALTNVGLILGAVTGGTGLVTSQNPAASTVVNINTYVSIVKATVITTVTVPNVVGMTHAAASTAIINAGLIVGTITGTQGNVTAQSPAAGATANANSAVNLTEVAAVQTGTVPNVVGMTQAAATTAITNAGFVLGTVTGTTGNNVVTQTPAAGTIANLNSSININLLLFAITSGPTATSVSQTSEDINWVLSQVATGQVEYGTTTAYGTLSTPETSFNYSNHTQRILGLTAGTLYHYRVKSSNQNSVQVTSSDFTFTTAASSNVTVPNVVGMTQAAANTALNNVGLVTGTVSGTGTVSSQTPTAGSSVVTGSAVNIVLSSVPGGALNVKSAPYNAAGNGSTNDTAAIQAAITACTAGQTVYLPAGIYMVQLKSYQDGAGWRALRTKNNMKMLLDPAAEIRAIHETTNTVSGTLLDIYATDTFEISGGTLTGDRTNPQPPPAENGDVISIRSGSTNINIHDILIKDGHDDGIYIGYGANNIMIDHVVSTNNRRQGCSITAEGDEGVVHHITIQNSTMSYTNGTAPEDGIDVEPDVGGLITDVYILNNQLLNNNFHPLEVATQANSGISVNRITVTGNHSVGNGSNNFYFGSGTANITQSGNTFS